MFVHTDGDVYMQTKKSDGGQKILFLILVSANNEASNGIRRN